MSGTARPTVAARFGWGIALPAAALLAVVILLALTGRGREWAPAVALIFGITAIPVVMLANAWLLFVGWPRRVLLLAGLAVPAYVAVALAIFVHGSRGDDNAGARMLAPYINLVEAAEGHWLWLFLFWLAAMAGLVFAAVRRERALLQ